MSTVLSGDSDCQFRIHQKPFVGLARPTGGAHSAPLDPLAGLGMLSEKCTGERKGNRGGRQRREGTTRKRGDERNKEKQREGKEGSESSPKS